MAIRLFATAGVCHISSLPLAPGSVVGLVVVLPQHGLDARSHSPIVPGVPPVLPLAAVAVCHCGLFVSLHGGRWGHLYQNCAQAFQ